MSYHQEILRAPGDHGLQIQRFEAGSTPCLLCSPDPSGKLGKRGIILRNQLTLRGLALKPAGETIGTLVLLHGRSGRKEDWLPVAERFCAVGFRCILPDLPAHGENPEPYTTYGVKDPDLAARALRTAASNFHFDPQPAGLIGMSMGGSFAVHSSALPNAPWKSLAIICSFDSFPAIIRSETSHRVTPALAPVCTSAIDFLYKKETHISLFDIEPEVKARSITIPVIVAHGDRDGTIPIAAGQRLYQAFASPEKRWVVVPTADHDTIFITSYPIFADLSEWMLHHVTN